MRKIFNHCLFMTFVMFSGSFLAQIPNSGFENWTTVGTYENPTSWSTLNSKTAAQMMFTATKATPGNPGSYYLKLTSKMIGSSVVPGVAVCGKMDSISTQPLCGVTYTARPAYFNGKWQHMIYGSSQGYIKVLLSRWNAVQGTRDTVASGVTNLSGMAMSWANFVFALTYVDSLHYPDSCMIEMRASGGNPTNNDYLWVDNLSFSGTVSVAVTPTVDVTGIKANTQVSSELSVFPVPAKNEITINFPISSDKTVIQIFDNAGNLVQLIEPNSEAVVKKSISLNTEKMAKGVYTLVIKTGDSTKSRKIVIE